MRPPCPVPRMADGSRAFSDSRRRTAGLRRVAAATSWLAVRRPSPDKALTAADPGAPPEAASLVPTPTTRAASTCPAATRLRPAASSPAPTAAAPPSASAASILPNTSPGAISSCSPFTISRKIPAPGDATSTVTLSVSISISGSFSATVSPISSSATCYTCDRVPSVCSAGARISTAVVMSFTRSQAVESFAECVPASERPHRATQGYGGWGYPAWSTAQLAHRD